MTPLAPRCAEPTLSAMKLDATLPGTPEPAVLLTERQAADFLRCSPRTLQAWRVRGGAVPFVKLGRRCVRYRKADLERWVDEQRRSSTSDPGPGRSGETLAVPRPGERP
jgi:excisionase family DNA binding protein